MSEVASSDSVKEVHETLSGSNQPVQAKMASDAEFTSENLMEKIDKIEEIEKNKPQVSFINGTRERTQIKAQSLKKNLKELIIMDDVYSKVAEEIMEAGKEAIKTHISNNASNFVNAINCAFLTMSNPEEYPNFSSLLKKFNLFTLKTSDLNEVRAIYVKTLEKISEWEKFKSI